MNDLVIVVEESNMVNNLIKDTLIKNYKNIEVRKEINVKNWNELIENNNIKLMFLSKSNSNEKPFWIKNQILKQFDIILLINKDETIDKGNDWFDDKWIKYVLKKPFTYQGLCNAIGDRLTSKSIELKDKNLPDFKAVDQELIGLINDSQQLNYHDKLYDEIEQKINPTISKEIFEENIQKDKEILVAEASNENSTFDQTSDINLNVNQEEKSEQTNIFNEEISNLNVGDDTQSVFEEEIDTSNKLDIFDKISSNIPIEEESKFTNAHNPEINEKSEQQNEDNFVYNNSNEEDTSPLDTPDFVDDLTDPIDDFSVDKFRNQLNQELEDTSLNFKSQPNIDTDSSEIKDFEKQIDDNKSAIELIDIDEITDNFEEIEKASNFSEKENSNNKSNIKLSEFSKQAESLNSQINETFSNLEEIPISIDNKENVDTPEFSPSKLSSDYNIESDNIQSELINENSEQDNTISITENFEDSLQKDSEIKNQKIESFDEIDNNIDEKIENDIDDKSNSNINELIDIDSKESEKHDLNNNLELTQTIDENIDNVGKDQDISDPNMYPTDNTSYNEFEEVESKTNDKKIGQHSKSEVSETTNDESIELNEDDVLKSIDIDDSTIESKKLEKYFLDNKETPQKDIEIENVNLAIKTKDLLSDETDSLSVSTTNENIVQEESSKVINKTDDNTNLDIDNSTILTRDVALNQIKDNFKLAIEKNEHIEKQLKEIEEHINLSEKHSRLSKELLQNIRLSKS